MALDLNALTFETAPAVQRGPSPLYDKVLASYLAKEEVSVVVASQDDIKALTSWGTAAATQITKNTEHRVGFSCRTEPITAKVKGGKGGYKFTFSGTERKKFAPRKAKGAETDATATDAPAPVENTEAK